MTAVGEDVHDRRARSSGTCHCRRQRYRPNGNRDVRRCRRPRPHHGCRRSVRLTKRVSSVPGITGTAGDAATSSHVDRVLSEIKTGFDGLDVLVNNVGIAGPTGAIETYADADIERTIDVNLKSHFYFLNRCVPLLKASPGKASIVAMSSVAGRLGYALPDALRVDQMGHRRPHQVSRR